MEKETIGGFDLYLGDCLSVLPEIELVDAIITDPPYGLAGANTDKNNYESFEDSPDVVKNLVTSVIASNVWTRLIMTPGQKMMFSYPEPTAVGAFYYPAGTGSCSWGFVGWQPIFYYGKDPVLQDGKGRAMNSFESTEQADKYYDHPCPKPINTWTKLVARATRENEIVLDPFMGTGTTGVSCVKTNRRFIGIEIERKYFDMACERITMAQNQGSLF